VEVIYTHCCGLDVHKKTVVACTITPEGKEICTFSTMTGDLISMVDWIKNKGCTHVAMESTGSFWKPIFNLLELEDIQALVVNAKHIKNKAWCEPCRRSSCTQHLDHRLPHVKTEATLY